MAVEFMAHVPNVVGKLLCRCLRCGHVTVGGDNDGRAGNRQIRIGEAVEERDIQQSMRGGVLRQILFDVLGRSAERISHGGRDQHGDPAIGHYRPAGALDLPDEQFHALGASFAAVHMGIFLHIDHAVQQIHQVLGDVAVQIEGGGNGHLRAHDRADVPNQIQLQILRALCHGSAVEGNADAIQFVLVLADPVAQLLAHGLIGLPQDQPTGLERRKSRDQLRAHFLCGLDHAGQIIRAASGLHEFLAFPPAHLFEQRHIRAVHGKGIGLMNDLSDQDLHLIPSFLHCA